MLMTRLLRIFDTWLIMIVSILFLWFGMASIQERNRTGTDVVVGLLGGIVGVCWTGLLCSWRHRWTRPVLIVLRLILVACFAYFTWFQERAWFALDDSALVRGSLQQEFLLQRLEQIGCFLLIVVPIVVLGIWHERILPHNGSGQPNDRKVVTLLITLVVASLVAGIAVRLIGALTLGPMFWIVSAVGVLLLIFELARRVDRAELPAFVAFAVFSFVIPLVLLWSWYPVGP